MSGQNFSSYNEDGTCPLCEGKKFIEDGKICWACYGTGTQKVPIPDAMLNKMEPALDNVIDTDEKRKDLPYTTSEVDPDDKRRPLDEDWRNNNL